MSLEVPVLDFCFLLCKLTAFLPTQRSTPMAQFLFESDLNGLLKLDAPIPNAPPARWQRKAKEVAVASGGPTLDSTAPSPMKPANRPLSTSKTPSKTPGKTPGFCYILRVSDWVAKVVDQAQKLSIIYLCLCFLVWQCHYGISAKHPLSATSKVYFTLGNAG